MGPRRRTALVAVLTAVAMTSVLIAPGGVYAYGSSNACPSSSFNAANYWVDVDYTP